MVICPFGNAEHLLRLLRVMDMAQTAGVLILFLPVPIQFPNKPSLLELRQSQDMKALTFFATLQQVRLLPI